MHVCLYVPSTVKGVCVCVCVCVYVCKIETLRKNIFQGSFEPCFNEVHPFYYLSINKNNLTDASARLIADAVAINVTLSTLE